MFSFVGLGGLQNIHYSVVVTEGRPDETGLKMMREMERYGLKVPVSLVLDSGVAYYLHK